MQNSDVIYGVIPSGELNINERELQRRLGIRDPLIRPHFVRPPSSQGEGGDPAKCGERPPGSNPAAGRTAEENREVPKDTLASPSGGGVPEGDGEGIASLIDKCRTRLLKEIRCRYAWARVPLGFPEEGVCTPGDFRIESRDLCRNLQGCGEAVLMGVTLGLGADRLLLRLEKTKPAEHFITDAIASAAVEALCDRVDRQIREELGKEGARGFRPRYSPGYGDCSIEVQRPLLQRIGASGTLGITLNEVCFMTPVKSITAIMGIKK